MSGQLQHLHQLPAKEAGTFRTVMKLYDTKNYKKAIKHSDTILKKFPTHGETLAMKGLASYFLLPPSHPKTPAYDLVKKGLKFGMTSHVCWHVYGLLYRQDRNYPGAVKCYKQALRIDPVNQQILRDMALLQIQIRDLDGFRESRSQLLNLKSNIPTNWISFAVAVHLLGDNEQAVEVIDKYNTELACNMKHVPFDVSELALYKNQILSEIPNNTAKTISHLLSVKSQVLDKNAYYYRLGSLQLSSPSTHAKALKTFGKSFARGVTEDYSVHSGYICALLSLPVSTCAASLKLSNMDTVCNTFDLSEEQKATVVSHYETVLKPLYPRSSAVKRIPLTVTSGDSLKSRMDVYLRANLKKGVPSLGADVSGLFKVPNSQTNKYEVAKDPIDLKKHEVFKCVEGLVDGYLANLEESGKWSKDEAVEEDEQEEPPSSLLWTYYLKSHLHELLGEYSAGLAVIEKCLAHTPTGVDIYEKKGRLTKLSGNVPAAAEIMDHARGLDLGDRYINNKTTKYLMRAGRPDDAENRIGMFTRFESNPTQYLFDMQCSWYELEYARCMAEKGEWGKALKKFVAVEKHFEDFAFDQFDFHSYCIRKYTLRSYVAMIRFEDEIWGKKFYTRAAEGIIKTYLHLHENPIKEEKDEEPDFTKMTSAEKKRWKQDERKRKGKIAKKKEEEDSKKKKEEEDAKKEEKEKADAGKTEEELKKEADEKKKNNDKDKDKDKEGDIPDADPDGVELAKMDPLAECKRVVKLLCDYAPKDLKTWLAKYDVTMRRGKTLLALQALKKGLKIVGGNAEHDVRLWSRVVDFAVKTEVETEIKGGGVATEIVKEEVGAMLGGVKVGDFVGNLKEKMTKKGEDFSSEFRIAIARAIVLVGGTGTGSGGECKTILSEGSLEGRGGHSVLEAAKLFECIEETCGKGEGGAFAKLAKAKFPLSTFFESK